MERALCPKNTTSMTAIVSHLRKNNLLGQSYLHRFLSLEYAQTRPSIRVPFLHLLVLFSRQITVIVGRDPIIFLFRKFSSRLMSCRLLDDLCHHRNEKKQKKSLRKSGDEREVSFRRTH